MEIMCYQLLGHVWVGKATGSESSSSPLTTCSLLHSFFYINAIKRKYGLLISDPTSLQLFFPFAFYLLNRLNI